MEPTDASAVLAVLHHALQDENEVDVVVELRDLTRATFDRLRRAEPELFLNRREEWTATLHPSESLSVTLYTFEGPVASRRFEVVS